MQTVRNKYTIFIMGGTVQSSPVCQQKIFPQSYKSAAKSNIPLVNEFMIFNCIKASLDYYYTPRNELRRV